MRIALDATYSLGEQLTGVGVYSREILSGVTRLRPAERFVFCYRPHRILRSFRERLPANSSRRLLTESIVPRSADLFHALNQRLPAARLRRTVVTFHDLFVLTGDYSSPEFRARFERQARQAAARADAIVTVSEFTACQVAELLGYPRGRIHVIPHGARRTVPANVPREKIVLHVGAIQKRKNTARLVRAFAALGPEWKLVLAGSAGYGAEEAMREIDRSGRVEVLGWVPSQELARLYARASIFAFPSLGEGFGIPVLEAMANGVPALVSNTSALPEVAGDAALLVDPYDTDAIARGLRELAGNPELREQLRARGEARAAAYTWEAAVAKTWAVYEEVLDY